MHIEAVGAAAGISQGFVSKLERDQVSPSVASLVAGVLMSALAVAASAQDLPKVTVGMSGWGIGFKVATARGWWRRTTTCWR